MDLNERADRAQRAEDQWAQGADEAAFRAYRQLVREYLGGGDNASDNAALDAHVIRRFAELAGTLGHLEVAENAFDLLLDIYDNAGNAYAYDSTSIDKARLLVSAGRYGDGEDAIAGMKCEPGAIEFTSSGIQELERRLTWQGIPVEQGRQVIIRTLNELGRCEGGRGAYGVAIAALERAKHLCESDAALLIHRNSVLIELASAHQEGGEFQKARGYLQMVEQDTRDLAVRVLLLEIGAQLDLLEGALGSAVAKLEEASNLCLATGRADAAARELLNLASTLIVLNQLGKAEAILSRIDIEHADESVRQRVAGLRALSAKRAGPVTGGPESAASNTESWGKFEWREAEEDDSVPADMGSQRGFLDRFQNRSLRLYGLFGREDYGGAASELGRLREEFGATDSVLIQARLEFFAGLVAYYGGKFAEAGGLIAASAEAFERMGDRFDQWQALRAMSWVAFKTGNEKETAQNRLRSDQILENMASSLRAVESAEFYLNKWTVEEEHLSGELRDAYKVQRSLWNSLNFLKPVGRVLLQRRLHGAMVYIDDHRRLVSEEQGLKGVLHRYESGLRAWQETEHTPVLRFVVLPDRIVCILVHGWDARIVESDVTRVGIREAVAGFHRNVHDTDAGEDSLARAAEWLGKIAQAIRIDELIADLKPGTELRILPDDCLHGIPFAALPLAGEKPLGERFAVGIASNWQSRESHDAPAQSNQDLLVALSYKDCDLWNPRLKFLPGAKTEAELIRAWHAERNHADAEVGEKDVTIPLLLERLPKAEYVHLICHGAFQPDDPAASGLWIRHKRYQGGVLSIRDLAVLDLRRVRHVALSSCWGADNYASPGRYIVSLPETLLRAGAGTILASLWPVNDRVAPRFMKTYYDGLAKLRPAEALRLAQKEIREDPEFEAPYYWAGYTVYVAQ